MLGGQVVDTESAKDFMKEALTNIDPGELDKVSEALAEKSRRFKERIGNVSVHPLEDSELQPVLRNIFSVRRQADRLLEKSKGQLGGWIAELLHGSDSPERRFETFCGKLSPLIAEPLRHDFASELMHFVEPEKFWLWTRWMWDANAQTGALPLVIVEGVELEADSLGESYLRVGEAVTFVRLVGMSAGFTRIGRGPYGVYVYLACVYAVYVYTTLRLRMTQEFNKVVPQFPDLIRRLLGVHRLEV